MKPIKSLGEYISVLSDLSSVDPSYVFRGQANSRWKLSSSAARRLKIESNNTPAHDLFRRYHSNLIKKYRQQGLHDEKIGLESSDVELLSKIQHYGGATGLVDFTKNAVVALWFGCDPYQKENGRVFVLNLTDHVDEIAKLSFEESKLAFEDLLAFKTRRPSLQDPSKASHPNEGNLLASLYYWLPSMAMNNRVLSQHSCFLFGLPILNDDERFRFIEIDVDQNSKSIIREQIMKLLNIDHSRMFSDFAGYSTYCHHFSLDINHTFFEDRNGYSKVIEQYQNNDFDQAIIGFTKVIKSLEGNNDQSTEDCEIILSRFYRGLCYREKYYRKGKNNEKFPVKAIKDFEYIINSDKSSPRLKAESLGNLGAIYMKELNDINEAIRKFNAIIEMNGVPYKQIIITHFYLGRAKQESGDINSAIDEYTKAISHEEYLSPEQRVKAYISRGECYATKKDYTKALLNCRMTQEISDFSDELTDYINKCQVKWGRRAKRSNSEPIRIE